MTRFDFGRKTLFMAILSIGLLQMSAHYIAGSLVRSDGGMAIPQTDTLLYCQAAKRVAEGRFLSFSADTAPSTGTTSHLYPFVLSVPYMLGCKGDALIRAGFFLNGFLYLIFLAGWCLAVDRKLSNNCARIVAVVTIGALGQTAYSAFAQSDIGIWLAVSGLFVAGLALEKRWAYGSLLVLSPWVRPEGMVCSIAFAIIVGACMVCRRKRLGGVANSESCSKRDVAIALLALASTVGVFAFNFAITGNFQFSSIAHKGYFKTLPFANAVFATCIDFLKIAKSIFLGLPDGAPRDFYGVPVLSAGLFWYAIFTRDWRKVDWHELVWLLAAFGGMLTVAQSGWQNTNVDRYLGWILPIVFFLAAEGAGNVVERYNRHCATWLVAGVHTVFVVAMAPVFACMIHMTSGETDLLRAFAVNCERVMEPGRVIGTWGDCGFVYEMPNRKVAHLGGIYSPEYMVKEPPFGVYEIIKNEPDKRFEYLFYNPSTDDVGLSFNPLEAFCSQVLVGPFGYELRRVDWTCFDAAERAPRPADTNLTLMARVDVGYDPDEKAHGYENIPLYDQLPLPPFIVFGENGGEKMIDVGRIVFGMDVMNVDLAAGKDVHVVMRTWPSHKATLRGGFGTRNVVYGFSNPLKLTVIVNGIDAGNQAVKINETGFSDVEMTIPGRFFAGGPSRLEFHGEHIACAYWFYQ